MDCTESLLWQLLGDVMDHLVWTEAQMDVVLDPRRRPNTACFVGCGHSNGLVTHRTQECPKKVLGGIPRSLLGNPGATPDSPQTLYSVYVT